MVGECTIIVGVEDSGTAGIVAVEAAHVAIEQGATALILLHVLDEHPVLNAVYGMGNYCAPVAETSEEGERLLAFAEQVLRAEFDALGKAPPAIRHELAVGDASSAIERVATESAAAAIVLGARRPHAFGRLTHPDVRAHVATHAPCRVHVATLQA